MSAGEDKAISSRIFVGNLDYATTQPDLETLFSQVGDVAEVVLPVDRATGRVRGFAFVEFSDPKDVQEAIDRFDGVELGGRALRVSEALERGAPSYGDPQSPRSPDRPRKASRPKGSRRGVRGRKRGF